MARFKILRKLGAGGMGTVYLALQEELRREVALKMMRRDHEDEGHVARFHREAKLMSQLAHPNIVRVFDSGEMDGQLFYAMELVRGESLLQMAPMSLEEVMPLLEQAADALAYLHERELYHRDVKPANFVVDEARRLILIDFGLAKTSQATALTADGALVGTARYLAPESVRGDPPEGPADVFALACTAHEILTGRPAFEGSTLPEVMAAILSPRRPRLDLVPDLPAWFLELQEGAFDLDPARRPRAAEYRDRLRAHRPATAAHPVARVEERRPARGRPSGATPVAAPVPAAPAPGGRVLPALAGGFLLGILLVTSVTRWPAAPAAPVPVHEPSRAPVLALEPALTTPSTTAPAEAAVALREAAARSFLVHPNEKGVFLDVCPGATGDVEVAIGLWQDRIVRERRRGRMAEGWFQGEIDGLRPATEYFVRVTLGGGGTLIQDYRFRTLGATHRDTLAQMIRALRENPGSAGHAIEFIASNPDLRSVPLFLELLDVRKITEITAWTKIALLARRLRNRDLARALHARLGLAEKPSQRGDILLAGVEARLPEAIEIAIAELDAAATSSQVEAGVLAGIATSRAYENIARAHREGRVGDWVATGLARLNPREALLGSARTKPGDYPARFTCCALILAEMASDNAALTLGMGLLDRTWALDPALDGLAIMDTPRAQQTLMILAESRQSTHEELIGALAALQRTRAYAHWKCSARLEGLQGSLRREVLALCAVSDVPPEGFHPVQDLTNPDPEMATLCAYGLALKSRALPLELLSKLREDVQKIVEGSGDAGGLASWALARIGGKDVAPVLRAQLEKGEDSRRPGIALGLSEIRDAGAVARLRALAGEEGQAPAAKEALSRAADVIEGKTVPGQASRVFVVPASIRALPTGIELVAGQSVDISCDGWWGPDGKPPRRCEEGQELPDSGTTLAATARVGLDSWRLGRRPSRVLATRAGELVLTPYAGNPRAEWLLRRPPLHGFAVVTVSP